eukprot:322696-Chlamydomonas_euryale.AAC.1
MDVWTDGWMDGRMDGCMVKEQNDACVQTAMEDAGTADPTNLSRHTRLPTLSAARLAAPGGADAQESAPMRAAGAHRTAPLPAVPHPLPAVPHPPQHCHHQPPRPQPNPHPRVHAPSGL